MSQLDLKIAELIAAQERRETRNRILGSAFIAAALTIIVISIKYYY